jgi:hypothetical protein
MGLEGYSLSTGAITPRRYVSAKGLRAYLLGEEVDLAQARIDGLPLITRQLERRQPRAAALAKQNRSPAGARRGFARAPQ